MGTEVRRARPLLGTLVDIRAAADVEAQRLHDAVDAAFAAVEQVHSRMSFHEPDSMVSLLNREAHRRAVHIDEQTHEVLRAAQDMARLSEGAFDITVGPRLQRWGYLPVSPAPTRGAASWRDIELLPDRSVRFRRALRIDLGGIAKGYAVDRAVAVLRGAGVESAAVNAGGDLRVFGPRPQSVSLRHPQDPARLAHELVLENEALASSASYFSRRRRGGAEVSALLDPRSGRPWLGCAAVSVRAADCLSADALTKVVLFAPPDLAERVLAAYGAQALVQEAGSVAA
jgi:thiamine biosynthesis lipoprotein